MGVWESGVWSRWIPESWSRVWQVAWSHRLHKARGQGAKWALAEGGTLWRSLE